MLNNQKIEMNVVLLVLFQLLLKLLLMDYVLVEKMLNDDLDFQYYSKTKRHKEKVAHF